MSSSALAANALQIALNRYLSLDPDALSRTAALAGKVLGLELLLALPGSAPADSGNGLRLTLYLLPGSDGIRVTDHYPGAPDVLIRGTPLGLVRQAGRGARGGVGSNLEIEGDTQLGKSFQKLLTEVDIDWEEQLSRWVGDVAAHQLGNVLRGLGAWGRSAVDTVFKNTAEYLQEEVKELPPSGAVTDFLNAVDTLRSDTDRLEARIRRLQQAMIDSST